MASQVQLHDLDKGACGLVDGELNVGGRAPVRRCLEGSGRHSVPCVVAADSFAGTLCESRAGQSGPSVVPTGSHSMPGSCTELCGGMLCAL